MKKLQLLSIFLITLITTISCSSEDSDNDNPVPEVLIETPVIDSISHNSILQGNKLSIFGSNFIDKNNETLLVINGNSKIIQPISNTKIDIDINEEIGIEKNSLQIQIKDKKSNTKEFFVIPTGWYKSNFDNLDIIKAFVYDSSNTVTILADTKPGTSYYGSVKKLVPSINGYEIVSTEISGGNKNDLRMYNEAIGITTNANRGYFSSNSFNTSKGFGSFIDDGEIVIETYITHVDENSSIITNCCSAHIMTNDKGETFKSFNASTQLFSEDRLRIRTYGKGSDGFFYELGYDLKTKNNYVIKSANGFDNWELIDISSEYSLGTFDSRFRPIFYDYDLILSINADNELVSSNNLAKTWTKIKTNVQNVFVKDKDTWFIQSDDKIYYTSDSGNTWNLELELPANSVINHMSFSEKKTTLSGTNLFYIKHE